MKVGDLKGGSVPTFTAQLVTLVPTIVDPIAGSLLRNVFSIHTLEGLICQRICKAGVIFVKFIYRLVV